MKMDEADRLYILATQKLRELGTKNSIQYFEKAAELNHHEALYFMGEYYRTGCSYQKAFEYFERAIKFGNLKAMVKLGNMYVNGLLGYKDFDKAKALYEQAYNEGKYPEAIQSLAEMYVYGYGVPKDITKALLICSEAYKETQSLTPIDVILEIVKYNSDEFAISYLALFAKIKELEAQVAYQPDGSGYLEAKQHFESLQS